MAGQDAVNSARAFGAALDLTGVEVHGEHAVGARGLEHTGHQACADWLARR